MKHTMKQKHECPECFQTFSAKTQLEHHFVNHHCEADIQCVFDGCSKVFKNITSQKVHYTRKHMKQTPLFIATSEKEILQCLTCSHTAKRASIYYHVANCSPQSPFCSTFHNASDPFQKTLSENIQSPQEDDLIMKLLMEVDLDDDFFIPSYFDDVKE